MHKDQFKKNVFFILLSMAGGYIFSFSGAPIAWLLGSLMTACLVSTIGSRWIKEDKGFQPIWRQMGQAIIGIELGQNFKVSMIHTLEEHYIVILISLLSTIAISILSGMVLWRFSSADMMTCLFGSTPGGISAMPAIAEEVGANALVVSIIQTLRILLVVGIIPLLVGALHPPSEKIIPIVHHSNFYFHSIFWTFFLLLGACGGAILGKKVKMPAPWLIGSMLGTVLIQIIGTIVSGERITAYWPHHFIILAQILIGTSIGSNVRMEMFKGLGRIFFISFVSTLGLVIFMMTLAVGISAFTHISLVTCILAFAPGGVAEMSTTAIALHADAAFVLAVQSLRLMLILILLPPLFRVINHRISIASLQKKTMDRTH